VPIEAAIIAEDGTRAEFLYGDGDAFQDASRVVSGPSALDYFGSATFSDDLSGPMDNTSCLLDDRDGAAFGKSRQCPVAEFVRILFLIELVAPNSHEFGYSSTPPVGLAERVRTTMPKDAVIRDGDQFVGGPGGPGSTDGDDLAAFGYRQELDRRLGGFSSFAAGFSYISILTGMFQLFYVGFGAGGPAFFWTWLVYFAGQFLVALCFAELAAHYPLAGGVYQWSRRVGSPAIGWMTGWVYAANLIISIAAVALALQVTLPQITPHCQLIGELSNPTDWAMNGVLLGCLLIGLTTLINVVGVNLLARINNVGVATELAGVMLLIVLLAVSAVRGPAVVLDTQGRGTGQELGYVGAFLSAALMASYVMYGFDTAGTLAEETLEPRRNAPRAILLALASAALAGALLMLFAMMAVSDVRTDALSRPNGGLGYIVTDVAGASLGRLFLVDVIFAVGVCALAVHAGAARLLFAMARDNNLPCSAALSRVSGHSRTPAVSAVVAGALAAVFLVVNVFVAGLFDLIVPVAILWANLAYLFVTAPQLVMRWRGWPARGGSGATGVFALGRWGLAVNLAAVVWSVLVIVNIGWPRGDPAAVLWPQRYGAVLLTGILVTVGGAYYVLVQRYKTHVRDEHRA
jgi:urea carboxylase system permease